MPWKPRLPVKTVEQAMAAVLPILPDVRLEPAELASDEDVMEMVREMERQDPRRTARPVSR